MTRRQVVVEEAVSLSLGKYLHDPGGLGELLEAIDSLTDDPRPVGAVSWGPVISRLHVGPYRVLYEIGESTIWVRRVDRVV